MSRVSRIRTSQTNWLKRALIQYRNANSFEFVDDASFGIRKKDLQSPISLVKRVHDREIMTWKEIAQIVTGIGMAAIGLKLILLAIMDPEPTSRLAILLTGGVTLILGGSYAILKALGQEWRVHGSPKNGTVSLEPA